jgi:hypothetical protein
MSNLVLHAIVMKKPAYSSKEEALKKAKEDFKHTKTFVRETGTSFRVRVVPKQHFQKTKFVSKKVSPDMTLVFGTPNEKYKGGAISTDELGKFVEASYKKKGEVQDVNGYKIDNELSTRRNKVYTNDKGEAVVAIAGTDNMKDWSNNLLIPFGLHSETDRYKNSEETLRKTNAKYGKQKVSVIGHSQSGHIVNDLADRDLIGSEAIAYNPAIIGKTNKKVKVVKSQLDPVSILTQTKKGDVVIKPTSYNPFKYNPFTAHSTKPLKN